MTKEQKKALARIFRRQARFLADMPALESLLDTYAKTKAPPRNWRERHLAEIQKTDDYREILEEFAPVISSLESSADDDELIGLCERMSRGKLPN
ncbi:MAG: hypothetical protein WAN65_32540 [Candidatus Sulfotelmatobacter sp.]